jgi:RHS repeat-associated protein
MPAFVLPTEDKPMAYKYKYNGKEFQDELGLNFYDYGARNYDPAIGRWMNVDPLAEQAPDWTPFRYGFNNPLRYNDPTGLSEEDWIPGVDDNGAVTYTAEKGDSAKTLSTQYGVTQEKAEQITGTQGTEVIQEGTEVKGEKVKQVTGSEVLKLDLKFKGNTDQDIINHFMFSLDHSKSEGKSSFGATEYFGNVFSKLPGDHTLIGKIDLNGTISDIAISLQFNTSSGAYINEKRHSAIFSNEVSTNPQSRGSVFGKNQAIQHNIFNSGFRINGKNLMGSGGLRITVPDSNGSKLKKIYKL